MNIKKYGDEMRSILIRKPLSKKGLLSWSLLSLSLTMTFPLSANAVCTQANCDRYNFEIPVGITNTSSFPALTTTGGNVGFGTETPLQPLHVIGSARLEAESADGAFLDFVISDATTDFTTTRLGTSQGGDFIFQSVDDSYLNPVTKMVISRSGKVGIGTDTPTRTLHVQTTDGMRLSPSTPPSTPAAGDIIVDSNDSNIMKYYNGSNWVNAGSGGGGGGSGSVTNISTGTGLTGGPITTTGTISIAPGGVGTTELGDNQVTDAKISAVGANKISSGTGLYLTYKPDNTACSAGQVLKWQNSRWECGDDNSGGSSPLTTKGDIFIHNGTGNIRLPAGSNGQVLKADSTQSEGLAWGAVIASDLSSLVTTGIVQRNGSSSYSTVTVASPLSYTGGTLGISTGSSGVLLDGGNATGSFLKIGTTDTQSVDIIANNTSGIFVRSDGRVSILGADLDTSYHKVKISSDLSVNGLTVGRGSQSLLAPATNSVFGFQALKTYSATNRCTAIGFKALGNNGGGDDNTAIGHQSLLNTLGGDFNTAVGSNSLMTNATGVENTSVGYSSLALANDSLNTAVGSRTLSNLSTGIENAGLGYNTGTALTSGTGNTLLGANTASSGVISGSNNTIIGRQIHLADGTWNRNTILGANISLATPTSGWVYIADGNGNLRIVVNTFGHVGVGVSAPTHILHINGQGRSTDAAWATTSDARLKDITGSFPYGLQEILNLDTIWFHYKKDNPLGLPSGKLHAGVVAQQVQSIIPEAIEKGKDGYLTLNADPIHWASVNAIKELSAQVDDLKIQNKLLIHYICSKDQDAAVCQ
ncbi:MAG TPA: tail fiber domain-containing protein [Pseudobdellovibrionaceae bacterium]|nr:tail fiber domain-containing protein [Pseudobdellovibrionaceae bacterium]